MYFDVRHGGHAWLPPPPPHCLPLLRSLPPFLFLTTANFVHVLISFDARRYIGFACNPSSDTTCAANNFYKACGVEVQNERTYNIEKMGQSYCWRDHGMGDASNGVDPDPKTGSFAALTANWEGDADSSMAVNQDGTNLFPSCLPGPGATHPCAVESWTISAAGRSAPGAARVASRRP